MRLGIDLGGTKIEIIALGDGGETLLRQRIATPQGDYLATVMAIAGLVERTRYALRPLGGEDWQKARAAYASFALEPLRPRA